MDKDGMIKYINNRIKKLRVLRNVANIKRDVSLEWFYNGSICALKDILEKINVNDITHDNIFVDVGV